MTIFNDSVKVKKNCDSNVNITFLNLHSSRDLNDVEHEVI